jgi:hypothetical protein
MPRNHQELGVAVEAVEARRSLEKQVESSNITGDNFLIPN